MTAHAGGAALSSTTSAISLPDARNEIRREMRARRRFLSHRERADAAAGFAKIAKRVLRPGMRVAVYLKQGGEADPGPVIALARQRNCSLYLPVITDYRRSRMEFARFDPHTPMRANRFGILEPDSRATRRIPVRRLDLVLLPLIAFDARGWRIGSGAGFYDRCLRHLRSGRKWRRPRLIGVGYEFQRVPQLDPQPWDVPMDAVLTEKNLLLAQAVPGENS